MPNLTTPSSKDLTHTLLAALFTLFGLAACSNGSIGTANTNTPSTPGAPTVPGAPSTYTLTVSNSGGGTVTSAPTGINCGTACSASFAPGTSVTLSAIASSGYAFTGWSGICSGTSTCTTTMSAARSVTAAFTLIPTGGNAINLSLVPARTSGVAPLSVFFDASGTTASATSRPFHDLEYRWDFGDTAGSPVKGTTWSTGSQVASASCSAPYNGCRNNATGAVTAHVYESAGTYTATLSVFDGTNTSTKTTTITVTDPATLTTACVANGVTPAAGDANGCPTVATLFYNTSSFNTALTTAITAGAKRVLFRKGDAFTSSATYEVDAAGPGIIGAYGTGASPNISMPPIAQYASAIKFFGASDWRVMDLAFDGTGTADQTAINNVTTQAQLTVLRVTATNFNGDVNANNIDQLAVVDSSFSSGGSNSTGSNYGVWCGICTNVMLLGNYMYLNTINSHNTRLQGVNKFVVSNSTQVGSNLIEPITVRGNTQYGVLSENKFVDNIVTVKPQNSTSNEYQHDIVFERNWFVAGLYTGPSLDIEGSGITVRNNIFDVSLVAGSAINMSYTNTVGAPMPDLINIYNNTFYNSSANNGNLVQFQAIVYFAGADTNCHSEVKNNLAYSPNTYNIAPSLIAVKSGSCVITGAAGTFGNSSLGQIKTSPSFTSATPSIPADYVIGAGSYASHAGVTLPVFSDFFRSSRPPGSAMDIGAVKAP
jgi:hypothetical protein